MAEVRRRLGRVLGESVHLRYGPSLEVEGVVEDVTPELVQLRLSKTRTKLVTLLQVEASCGAEVPTAARLERPRVDGCDISYPKRVT